MMKQDDGAVLTDPGSREPDPSVPALRASIPSAEANRFAQELDCSPAAAQRALDNLAARGLIIELGDGAP